MLELPPDAARRRRASFEAAQGLRFLVLDELHTYRGRQGADVALLVRRVREALPGDESALRRHVGDAGRAGNVRRAAGRGRARRDPLVRRRRSSPENVIGETLRRATAGRRPRRSDVPRGARRARPQRCTAGRATTSSSPTRCASWIETTFGITWDADGPALPPLRPATAARRRRRGRRAAQRADGRRRRTLHRGDLQHALMRG